MKELEAMERVRRVKGRVSVTRDPERVTKPTLGWEYKVCSEQEDKSDATGHTVTYINHVPHL